MTMRSLRQRVLAISACLALGAGSMTPVVCASDAAPARPRIDTRYAADGVTEEPDFRQHVLPLIGQLGCNGRACHGSFQGQGGFRLSLFGYDFKADHDNLLAGDEPRTNIEKPVDSLILLKPLEEVPHEGGQRLEKGTWQYRVLLRWIEAGAKDPGDAAARFVRLELEPRELVARAKGDSWQLCGRRLVRWRTGGRHAAVSLPEQRRPGGDDRCRRARDRRRSG